MLEDKLFSYLKLDPILSEIVGTRILPNNLPPNIKKPAIVYFKYGRSKKRLYRNGGEVTERFQINVYADTYSKSKEIESALIKSLDGVEGRLGNSFSKVINVQDLYQNDLNMIALDVEITIF